MDQNNLNLSLCMRLGNAQKSYTMRQFYAGLKRGCRTYADKAYYCIRNEGESEENFKKRMEMTEHYDVSNRAIDIYSSAATEKAPILITDDAFIKSLYENFDIRGQSLSEVVEQTLKESFWDGMLSFMIDFDVDEFNNVIPYNFILDNDDILDVNYDYKGELNVLKYQTYETVVDPENEFNRLCLKTIWFWQKIDGKVYYRKWKQNTDLDFILDKDRTEYIYDKIPLKTFYPQSIKIKDLFNPRCTIEALAHKNIEHLRSNTEQRWILHTVRLPILFGKGFKNDGNTIVLSSQGVWCVEGEEGVTVDLKYVEPQSGKAIESGRTDIIDILQQMEVLGLSVLNKKSNITATATTVDDRQNTSIMSSYVKRLETFLNEVVDMMLDIKNAAEGTPNATKPEFRIELDTEYSDIYDQARIQFMQFLVTSQIASPDSAIDFAKKIGVMPQDANYDEERDKILDIGLQGLEITSEQTQ